MNGGMDVQYEQMKRFQQALIAFNESLRASMRDLEREHDRVSPHWQDQMRAQYDALWEHFSQTIKHYCVVEGPSTVGFLAIKIHATERYLNGG
jgi:uncharacterized protein YukE